MAARTLLVATEIIIDLLLRRRCKCYLDVMWIKCDWNMLQYECEDNEAKTAPEIQVALKNVENVNNVDISL